MTMGRACIALVRSTQLIDDNSPLEYHSENIFRT
jgi:hypothetical protein